MTGLSAISGPAESGKINWFALNMRVIAALAHREIKSRFGEQRLSYLASYIAPLGWVAATYLAFQLFGRTSPVYADTVTFIISGLLPYVAFRNSINGVGRSRSLVRQLLIYPTVSRWHSVVAMAGVELVNIFVFVTIVIAANYVIFDKGQMEHPVLFAGGLMLCWGLGVAYGCIFNALAETNKLWWSVGQTILRPSFFLSAIFFTANEMPEHFYRLIGWNPLLHAVEESRQAMLEHYDSRVASSGYVVLWIVAMFAAAALVSLGRRR